MRFLGILSRFYATFPSIFLISLFTPSKKVINCPVFFRKTQLMLLIMKSQLAVYHLKINNQTMLMIILTVITIVIRIMSQIAKKADHLTRHNEMFKHLLIWITFWKEDWNDYFSEEYWLFSDSGIYCLFLNLNFLFGPVWTILCYSGHLCSTRKIKVKVKKVL